MQREGRKLKELRAATFFRVMMETSPENCPVPGISALGCPGILIINASSVKGLRQHVLGITCPLEPGQTSWCKRCSVCCFPPQTPRRSPPRPRHRSRLLPPLPAPLHPSPIYSISQVHVSSDSPPSQCLPVPCFWPPALLAWINTMASYFSFLWHSLPSSQSNCPKT